MIPVAKPTFNEEEIDALVAALRSGWLTQGPRVQAFEEAFAAYTGAAHAIAVSSGTAALHLALLAAQIGPGDEVLCPSMSFIATANAIVHAGATPVFAEVGWENGNLDPRDVERRITPKTKAVILVHQNGMPADLDTFKALCDAKQLVLIEDAACAAGSSYKGAKIGLPHGMVCFSFHPRKVITTGEGGMITTNDPEYANRLRLLRHHAMSVSDRDRHHAKTVTIERYLTVGYNYRMSDLHAALGIPQLRKLDAIVEDRRAIARQYDEAFNGLEAVRVIREPAGCVSNYQSYALCVEPHSPMGRNALMQHLLDRGIASRRGVMTAHREPAYAAFGVKLPLSEDLSDYSILLPLYVPMDEADIDKVIDAVSTAVAVRKQRIAV